MAKALVAIVRTSPGTVLQDTERVMDLEIELLERPGEIVRLAASHASPACILLCLHGYLVPVRRVHSR